MHTLRATSSIDCGKAVESSGVEPDQGTHKCRSPDGPTILMGVRRCHGPKLTAVKRALAANAARSRDRRPGLRHPGEPTKDVSRARPSLATSVECTAVRALEQLTGDLDHRGHPFADREAASPAGEVDVAVTDQDRQKAAG